MLMQPWNPGPIKTGAPYMSRQLGWTASGRTRAPRIHDLRHRMVVRPIQAWHANGVDVDRKIIQLATYLGHVEVRNVYWYLSAVPELMSIVAGRFDDFAQQRGGNVMRPPQIGFPTLIQDFFLKRLIGQRGSQRPHRGKLPRRV